MITVEKPKRKKGNSGPRGWLRRCARELDRAAPHVSLVWNGHRKSAVLMKAILQWREREGLGR
jgi:hypothetical protein